MSDTNTEKDDSEARFRAAWLNSHNAPKDWLIITSGEKDTLKQAIANLERERDAYKAEIAKLTAERDMAITEMSKQARAAGRTDSQREVLEKCVHALEWLHREHGIETSSTLQEARAALARTK